MPTYAQIMEPLSKAFNGLHVEDESPYSFQFINVYKNPSKLPINLIHLERTYNILKRNPPRDKDILEMSAQELKETYFEKKTEVIPALDKMWLPKCIYHKFEPYVFTLSEEENEAFLTKNILFVDTLEFLLQCNFHQFWCTILFEPAAIHSIRSFLLNPISPFETRYLSNQFKYMYDKIYSMFLLLYQRLLRFKESEEEHISSEYAVQKLIEKKLLNLPIVITIAFLYQHSSLAFVNKLVEDYFNDTTQLDLKIKEVEDFIQQLLIVMEMIGGHVCGFDEEAVMVPIAIDKRPSLFSLSWVYSVVSYLLNTVAFLQTLFMFYKPGVEVALDKGLPFRLPFIYVSIYSELYQMLDNREELKTQRDLSDKIFDLMNMGRSEFVDLFHTFVSFCLDETIKNIGDSKKQEKAVETYMNLLQTALEDEYFICDYNLKNNVANLNDMFENFYQIDPARTEFIVSCINKFSRHKCLEQLCRVDPQTIEAVFKQYEPPVRVKEKPQSSQQEQQSLPSTSFSNVVNGDDEIENKIKDIMDMFPHLGDGYILQCLECYDFNTTDVINAILEENLPPHLCEIPFDTIRIPPEPEPEQPVLAYKGKKPEYDDALKLLNDKQDMQKIKTFVLEGVQYSNDYLYDDEYDDRDDLDVPVKVADNPLSEDIPSNPNHQVIEDYSSYSSEEDERESNAQSASTSKPLDKSKIPFCEDPAVIREQREARFRSKQNPQQKKPQTEQKRGDLVGKPKGQGQDKSVLLSRQKKNVNKSSRANHNRKGGASWKRNRGMIPS